MRKFGNKQFFILSIVCFVASLFFEGFATETSSSIGLECLISGLFGLLFGEGLEWLANPLLFIAWIFCFMKLRSLTAFSSASAILLMLTFLRTHSIIVNEAGGVQPIIRVGAGYWLWVVSAILCLVAALVRAVKKDDLKVEK